MEKIAGVKACLDDKCSTVNYELSLDLPVKVDPNNTISFLLVANVSQVYSGMGQNTPQKLQLHIDVVVNGSLHRLVAIRDFRVSKMIEAKGVTGISIINAKIIRVNDTRNNKTVLYLQILLLNKGDNIAVFKKIIVDSKIEYSLEDKRLRPAEMCSLVIKIYETAIDDREWFLGSEHIVSVIYTNVQQSKEMKTTYKALVEE